MDAHDILTLVRPFGVIGVNIGDLADPSTWTFQWDTAAAQQAILDALAAAPAPDPLTVLTERLDTLETSVQDIQANVTTIEAARPVDAKGVI